MAAVVIGGDPHKGSPTAAAVSAAEERLHELTAPQRRQLDDEASLVAAVMEATATLTVGTVTAGPHA